MVKFGNVVDEDIKQRKNVVKFVFFSKGLWKFKLDMYEYEEIIEEEDVILRFLIEDCLKQVIKLLLIVIFCNRKVSENVVDDFDKELFSDYKERIKDLK